jgi:hypothetical protein
VDDLSTPVDWMSELMGRPLTETERALVMSTTTLLNARRMLRSADRAAMEAEADLLGQATR